VYELHANRFRVNWNGRYAAGVDRVTALRGGRRGLSLCEPIVLSRECGDAAELEAWANRVWSLGTATAAADVRRDIVIELLDEAGQVALAWRVFGCWPSEYVSIDDYEPGGDATESLTLQNEGWERELVLTANAPMRRPVLSLE
jgi:hypothetical protein